MSDPTAPADPECPPLDQLADDDDELDACDIDFAELAVDELGELEAVLLGDTLPGTPEAEAKLAFYRAYAEASAQVSDEELPG
jgi:hypothetical protein